MCKASAGSAHQQHLCHCCITSVLACLTMLVQYQSSRHNIGHLATTPSLEVTQLQLLNVCYMNQRNFNCKYTITITATSIVKVCACTSEGGREWPHGSTHSWPTKAVNVQQQQQQVGAYTIDSKILTAWVRSTPEQQEECAAAHTPKASDQAITLTVQLAVQLIMLSLALQELCW